MDVTETMARFMMAQAVKTLREEHGGKLPLGRTDRRGRDGILIRVYATNEYRLVQMSVKAERAVKGKLQQVIMHFEASVNKAGILGKVKSWSETI